MTSFLFLSLLPLAAATPTPPLTLERTLALALERNADVLSAGHEVEASRWSRLSALGALGPRVRAEGSVQRWDKELETSFQIPNFPGEAPALKVRDQVTYSAQVTVVQPLLSLWSLIESYHIKNLGVDIARLGQLQAKRDVLYQATEAFYRLLQAKSLVSVGELSVAQVEAQLGKAQAFERQGLLGRNDVLRAEIALATAKQRMLLARGGESLAHARLRTLLRAGVDERLEIVATLAQTAASPERAGEIGTDRDTVVRRAQTQRSEITTVEDRLGQARSGRRAAWSRMLPQLNALASYQYAKGQAFSQPNQVFLGLSASWDVWEWGATYFGTREASARQSQAELGLERMRDAVALEAEAAFVGWNTAKEALAVAEKAVAQAEENFRIESKRYENASSTTFDVLDAETLLTQARAQRENSLFDLLVAQAGIRRATGELESQQAETRP